MTYRDDADALHARKEALEHELSEARLTLAAQDELAFRAARMERELAEIEARLRGEKKRLPMLDNVRVASPCNVSWDAMKGDDRVRFCGQCEKNVFNLSSMTRDEAEALIIATQGKICVRMYKRSDGTVLTQDCPDGVRRARRKRLAAALVGGAAMMAAAGFAWTRLNARAHGCVLPARPLIVQPLPVSVTPSVPSQTPPEDLSPMIQGQMVMGEPAAMEVPQSRPQAPRRGAHR